MNTAIKKCRIRNPQGSNIFNFRCLIIGLLEYFVLILFEQLTEILDNNKTTFINSIMLDACNDSWRVWTLCILSTNEDKTPIIDRYLLFESIFARETPFAGFVIFLDKLSYWFSLLYHCFWLRPLFVRLLLQLWIPFWGWSGIHLLDLVFIKRKTSWSRVLNVLSQKRIFSTRNNKASACSILSSIKNIPKCIAVFHADFRFHLIACVLA